MIKTTFNALAICGTAGFSGVMLCIGVTLGGYWRTLSGPEFLDWFAANNRFISSSIPLIFMTGFVGLAGSIWLSRNTPSFRLWFASGICLLVVAALTFAYFVPTNAAFVSKSIEAAAVPAKLDQWLSIHRLRISLAMIAGVLGCIAVRA